MYDLRYPVYIYDYNVFISFQRNFRRPDEFRFSLEINNVGETFAQG